MKNSISVSEVSKYLGFIREVKSDLQLYDMHVHPYEIIFNECEYKHCDYERGLLSTTGGKIPEIGIQPVRLNGSSPAGKKSIFISSSLKAGLTSRYSHTGPKILINTMNFSGIDKSLLLPVVRSNEFDYEDYMSRMHRLFSKNDRFSFALAVPIKCRDDDLIEYSRKMTSKFEIAAIKVHPNLSEIDIGKQEGQEVIERILAVCDRLHLPLIIHGGLSPICPNFRCFNYSSLDNLSKINWKITETPVIIAHGGLYGHKESEVSSTLLPVLKKMLSRHDNLAVDISGLPIYSICAILNAVDKGKILFGSDALYEEQWEMLVKLLYCLESSPRRVDEEFVKIVSENPAKYIFGEMHSSEAIV
jgi:predicted TIM-barrel fold metal-dependent hydrolase